MATERSDDTPLTFESPEIDWGNANVVESASSSDSPPAEASAEGQPPASATISPATPPADGVEARESDGPIPLSRHKAILDAERKQREDLNGRLTKVAWAEELAQAGASPDLIREAMHLHRGIDADPVGFLERFYAKLDEHPELQAKVRSWSARVLGSRNGHSAEPALESIDPDFRTEDGATFYSASRVQALVNKIVGEKVTELESKFAPLRDDYTARREQEAAARVYRQHADEAKSEYESLKDSPHFQEQRAAIKAHLESTGYRSLKDSYLHVLTQVVIPSLSKTEQAKTIAALQTQAHASTGRPGAAGATTPANPKSFFDPSMKW